MISTSVSFSPYSNYPSALTKPQAGKGSGAPESQDVPSIAGEKKTASEPQPSQQGLSKQGLSKEDPAKAKQDQKVIDELKKIDRNVRAHEQAHLAAAGGLAMSGATFTYRRGPDGQQYAVGGEVSIDVSPGRTPQETINKAERIKAAALAPADPSGQDRAVASSAAQMEVQAQQELTQEKLAATKGEGNASEPAAVSPQNKTSAPEASPSDTKSHHAIASYRANSTAAQARGGQINFSA